MFGRSPFFLKGTHMSATHKPTMIPHQRYAAHAPTSRLATLRLTGGALRPPTMS